MAVCYQCGRSSRTVELQSSGEAGGISVGSYHLRDDEFLCVDVDDCESTVIARRSDYPEDEPDEVEALEPWWHNR